MEVGQENGFCPGAQMDPGCVGLAVLADVLHQPLLHQGMTALPERGLFFIEIALVAIHILDLSVCYLVIVFVDKPVAEESQDHEIGKAFKIQGIQFPHEGQVLILREQVFQLVIEVAGQNGVIIQILKETVQKLEQFGRVQARPARLFRGLIVLHGADDRDGDVK